MTKGRDDPTLGFVLATVTYGDRLRTVARFQCVECGEFGDIPVVSGRPLNAEIYAKKLGQVGWQCWARKKTRTYCPKCNGPQPHAPEPEQHPTAMVIALPVPSTPAQQIARDPTPEQRVRVRGLLDKHFDDAVGVYLDGMDDNRVAELVGVPRVIVERMRETAYGPIRVDPALAALREAIAAIKTEIDGHQRGLDGLKTKAAELASKIERAVAGKAAA